jgi:hypothetical protein
MKNLLLTLIFLCNVTFATNDVYEVDVRGYGSNFTEQILNAKLQALSNVVGSFIIGDDKYSSDKEELIRNIKEYHGGYILKFDVTATGPNYVEINAWVKFTKDNIIHVSPENEIDISNELDNYKQKRDIIKYLDDPKHAFHIETNNISIQPQPHKIRFKISSVLKWQPKWVSDLETFVTTSTNLGKTTNQVNIVVVNQRGYDPTIGIIQSLFSFKPKQSDTPMVCFARKPQSDIDQCRNVAGGFESMPIHSQLPVIIKGYDKDNNEIGKIRTFIDGNNLYENVYRNQTKKYFLTKRTFDQPAFIVYKEGIKQFDITIDIDTDIAEHIKTFKLEASI